MSVSVTTDAAGPTEQAPSPIPSAAAPTCPATHAFEPYPLFIYLDGLKVVVIGGGAVAQRKVETLLRYGACVTIVAPDFTERLIELANQGRVTLVSRPYQDGDLEGAAICMAATDVRAVNEAVYEEAHRRGIIVNVADVPDLCNAIIPSVLQRGHLQIAVSTAGASPEIARDIRRDLEEKYPQFWEAYLDLLADLRSLIKDRVPGAPKNRMPLYEAVLESDVRARIERGELLDAEQVYEQVVMPRLGRSA